MYAIIASILLAGAVNALQVQHQPPFRNAALPIPARVADLLSHMNPMELIYQLHNRNEGTWVDIPTVEGMYGKIGMGTIFIDEVMNKSWSAASNFSTPLEALRSRNAVQAYFMTNTRLGIPLSFCMEGLHSGAWGGTVFPGLPALAQSWNDTLVQTIGNAIAAEARASGVDTALSPVVNMFSDPRFGRYQEGFCPDPTITAHMGSAMVLGLQGPASSPDVYLPSINTSVISQAKHYAAYGHAAGGMNGGVADMTNRSLHEVYLKPWRAMAAAGLRSLMVSHQTVNDIPCHGNSWLINTVMREQYGFGDGFTISDEMNIGHLGPWGWAVSDNISDAAALALTSGVDIDLMSGGSNATQAYVWLPQALDEGLIGLADLQKAAARVLTMKFAAGLFDSPYTDESGLAVLNSPPHQAVALEAARQGIVLVKNENGVLPLDMGAAGLKLALVGPFLSCSFSSERLAQRLSSKGLGDPTPNFCMAREATLGAYAQDNGQNFVPLLPEALSSTFPGLTYTVSQGAGIVNGPEMNLIPAALAAVQDADFAIVVLGDSLQNCDEGIDRDDLDLTPGQLALLTALASNTSTPLILVLLNGRPATFGPSNAVLSRVSAILVASRPGQMGSQAIVDILSGAVNPSGKLADSWAAGVGQIGGPAQPFLQLVNGEWASDSKFAKDPDGRAFPPYWDNNWAPTTPLFPFGFGLSYTTYRYTSITATLATPLRDLPPVFAGRAAMRTIRDAVVVQVTVSLCNTGGVDGTEVVQVYSRDPRGSTGGVSRVVRYWKRLVGYTRLFLAAGACGEASIGVTADDLAQYEGDSAGANLVLTVVQGNYTFSTGPHSRADNVTASLVVA